MEKRNRIRKRGSCDERSIRCHNIRVNTTHIDEIELFRGDRVATVAEPHSHGGLLDREAESLCASCILAHAARHAVYDLRDVLGRQHSATWTNDSGTERTTYILDAAGSAVRFVLSADSNGVPRGLLCGAYEIHVGKSLRISGL